MIKECHKHLDRLQAERRDDAAAFLDAAQAALRRRHEVVHSLWPFSSEGKVRGWRNVPKSRRQGEESVEWTSFHAEQLPDLVADLVDIVERCRQLEQWVTARVP